MNGFKILKNWSGALQRSVDAFGQGFIIPAFVKAGSVTGTIGKKTINAGISMLNGLSEIDYKKLGKNAIDKGKKIGVSGIYGLEQEAEFVGDSMNLFKYQLLGDAPITKAMFGHDNTLSKGLSHFNLLKRSDKSLLGVKATWKGMALAVPGALALGSPKAVKTFMDQRKGTNNGYLYTNTPMNTYGQAMGNSYANNAGATGDLVFALHNQRHSGII